MKTKQKTTLLIVDDSATQREKLKHTLSAGYRVLAAASAEEALSLLEREPVELLICDVLMPGMDGFSLCEKVKGNPRTHNLPVILLTTLADPEDIFRGLAASADHFLVKPCEKDLLLKRVQYLLLNKKVQEEERAETALELTVGGKKMQITSSRAQILHLLLSTFETALSQNRLVVQLKRELKLANSQLEEKVKERTQELQLFRDLIDQSSEGFFLLDRGKIADCNRGACKLTGLSRDKIVGRLFIELLPPSFREDFAKTRLKVRGIPHLLEIEFQQADGTSLPLELVLNTFQSEKEYLVVFARDISERKEMQMRYLHAQKMEALGRLSGGVAHDFNNLLTVISGYTALLKENLKNREEREYLDEIERASYAARSLTQSLLSFSRKERPTFKLCELKSLLQGLEKMLKRLVGELILFEMTLPELECPVLADEGQLQQVLMNLVVNARDAMTGSGSISVKLAPLSLSGEKARQLGLNPGDFFLLTVSDQGEGIAKEHLPHIFEPFFTTKEKGKGTGLGLSTVYSILKAHGGAIEVASEVGVGTTFSCYLPMTSSQEEKGEEDSPSPKLPSKTVTILLVDDDRGVRQMAERVLVKKGFRVLCASHAAEVFEKLGTSPFPLDCLVADLMMPDMGGVELAAMIQPLYPNCRTLFISGYHENLELPNGAHFLEKPFTPEELLHRITEILELPPNS